MSEAWHDVGDQVPRSGTRFTRWVGRTAMRLTGWQVEGTLPNHPKFIIAVAPHSSNFDFMLTVMVIWSTGIRASFLAKTSLFRFPLSVVMNYFGGIPVDRSSAQGLVEQMVELFHSRSKLILGIAPEGTRAAVTHWRKGFALIAAGANVPVLPAILDYQRKVVTFAPLIVEVTHADTTLQAVQQLAASGVTKRAAKLGHHAFQPSQKHR